MAWKLRETRYYAEGGAVVSLGTTLLLIGGSYRCRTEYESCSSRKVFQFDMILGKIGEIASMIEERTHHVAFMQDNRIVVAGGTNRLSIEYYDIKTNTWVPVTSSVPAFVESSAIFVNNRGFVCGSRRTNYLQKQTYECVKIRDDRYKWIERAPLNKANSRSSLPRIQDICAIKKDITISGLWTFCH